MVFCSKVRLSLQQTRGPNNHPTFKISLSAIGRVIEKALIKDSKGHIYQWDPRYNNLDVEEECEKQEALNLKFGTCSEERKTTPIFTLIGMKIYLLEF